MFVTPHTVESHLTQTYRKAKLGIGSRAGLARALDEDARAAVIDG